MTSTSTCSATISQLQEQLADQKKQTMDLTALRDKLQQQQQTSDKINDLLNQSSDSLLCGPNCQQTRAQEELQQKYLDAQTNVQTAPIYLKEAKKEYYLQVKGQSAYNQMIEQDLTTEANKIAFQLIREFKKQVDESKLLNIYYNSDIINSKNTKELYNAYRDENKELEIQIRDSYSDVLTNDRKTYYEIQEYDSLKWWYTLFLTCYYILALVFFGTIILSNNQMNLWIKLFSVVLLIIYPYIIGPIGGYIRAFVNEIKKQLPKNVYKK